MVNQIWFENVFVGGIFFIYLFFYRFIFLEHKACFQIFENYFKIKNFLYPNRKPVEFDKISKSECKIRKDNHIVEEKFSISYAILSINELFTYIFFSSEYDVVNISWNNFMNFQKMFSTKSFYFLFSNTNWKLNMEFRFREWNITLYVFNENMKTFLCSKKIPYKIEKRSSTK